jgi:hypothetical protein
MWLRWPCLTHRRTAPLKRPSVALVVIPRHEGFTVFSAHQINRLGFALSGRRAAAARKLAQLVLTGTIQAADQFESIPNRNQDRDQQQYFIETKKHPAFLEYISAQG